MDLSSNYQMLARYNQRINRQLLEVCKQLTEQQLYQQTNAFFPSVMAHWNHILFGDLIMLQRLVNNEIVQLDEGVLSSLPKAKRVVDTFATTLDELSVLRVQVDQIYLDFTQQLTQQDCNRLVCYTTTEGQHMERRVGEFLSHVFNHQTHHKGQLTCLLSQFDLDYGCMDLPVIVPEGAS